MKRTGTYFEVYRLQDNAALISPEILKREDKTLKASQVKGGLIIQRRQPNTDRLNEAADYTPLNQFLISRRWVEWYKSEKLARSVVGGRLACVLGLLGD